ncbi:Thiamine repressible regulatory protein thi1 [Tolypocladium paradoxum]|uniref:Thiamine repressible regulatory protein thi1 n=1 Tax=Tolypocladium paradoxum TaxID=94208 RepID=A0A2S4KU78_9HYPO|nr:Thiamine repressible regulatory protein thi1 [Tolypocladium paradoxum]
MYVRPELNDTAAGTVSQFMSRQALSSNGHDMERPTERSSPPKPSGRLRAACDSCHQAKIRCSGGSPCMTCEASQFRCTYSPGSRLGRPKGSKNKRTLMQEKSRRSETQEDNSGTDAMQWSGAGLQQQQQQQSDSMSVEFDLEHGSDATCTLADDFVADGTSNLLSGPSLTSLLDSMDGTRPNTNHDDDLNTFFAQASAALSQPSYRPLSYETSDSRGDSGYVTSTSSSPVDDTTLPSPHSIIFPSGKPEPLSTFTPREPSRCSCLQQQVQLVYQLGDLQFSHAGGPAVDCVLQGVQLAQGPWKGLMHCNRCQSQDSQKEAYLLFAMSIRILLSSVQKLNESLHPVDASHEAARRRAFSEASNVGVSVGNFELTGEAKAEVIGVAIRRALQNITSALLHLWDRTGRPKPLSVADLGNSNSRSRNNAPESPISILSSISTESQKSHHPSSLSSTNLGAEDIGSLLNTLQCTMQALKWDLRT